MRLYLSSYRVGDRPDVLRAMTSGRTVGVVCNALDHIDADERAQYVSSNRSELDALGIATTELDLRGFFGDVPRLGRELDRLGAVWVCGGNTFVLRQAMHLSGLDTLLGERIGSSFVYGGFSAGVCVLAPRLEGLHHVDDASVRPYPGSETSWKGLGILDYLVLPHFRSQHPESEAVERDVAYCAEHGIAVRTLRDGQVIVGEVANGHRLSERVPSPWRTPTLRRDGVE
jgi:dipeptidase E